MDSSKIAYWSDMDWFGKHKRRKYRLRRSFPCEIKTAQKHSHEATYGASVAVRLDRMHVLIYPIRMSMDPDKLENLNETDEAVEDFIRYCGRHNAIEYAYDPVE